MLKDLYADGTGFRIRRVCQISSDLNCVVGSEKSRTERDSR